MKKYEKKLLKIVSFFGIIFLVGILIINIIYSQNISPLFIPLINGDKKSTVSFLRKIHSLSIFKKELKKGEVIYGERINNDVFREEVAQKKEIKKLEQLLNKNPQSRDILYRLYLLNKQLGNKEQASHYYQQVKKIDPTIKRLIE